MAHLLLHTCPGFPLALDAKARQMDACSSADSGRKGPTDRAAAAPHLQDLLFLCYWKHSMGWMT